MNDPWSPSPPASGLRRMKTTPERIPATASEKQNPTVTCKRMFGRRCSITISHENYLNNFSAKCLLLSPTFPAPAALHGIFRWAQDSVYAGFSGGLHRGNVAMRKGTTLNPACLPSIKDE